MSITKGGLYSLDVQCQDPFKNPCKKPCQKVPFYVAQDRAKYGDMQQQQEEKSVCGPEKPSWQIGKNEEKKEDEGLQSEKAAPLLITSTVLTPAKAKECKSTDNLPETPIWALWTCEDCTKFLKDLNKNTWNIILTSNMSPTSLEVLNQNLFMDKNYMLTSLHRNRQKKKDANNVLQYASFLSPCLQNRIRVGQFQRFFQNISTKRDFRKHARDLTHRLKVKRHRTIGNGDTYQPYCESEEMSLRTRYYHRWLHIFYMYMKHSARHGCVA
ncbi:uncharacterized protein [Dendropsophus ebraccatus]|uniref:uncharacterized protein n=1 Tax=Dendropsophus ebraccatus TaxID=150705 RepID=UPI003831630E